ncbi:MAG: 30S ribosome-binding factor RbfA [Alphaproteobacteria bacterium]|nr:30S ribosome-binding factor RbfA [Alphaproteobacteria bacterium]
MPRPSHHRPQGPSQRQLRVAEEIRRIMVEIFNRAHWREPVLINTAITVTAARISPDLKNVTIFCMPLGGAHVDEVIAALNRSKGYLRGELGHAISLRHVPDLRFAEDRSFEEAQHIEELLRTERVRRDLAAKGKDEQE